MLALRSRGLGPAYTTLHPARGGRSSGRAARHPRHGDPVRAHPAAYTVGVDFRPADRRPVRDVTYLNGWRQRLDATPVPA